MADQHPPGATPSSRTGDATSILSERLSSAEQATVSRPPPAPKPGDEQGDRPSEDQDRNQPPADGTVRLADVIQILGLVVAPTTLVTALLYYFGWASTGAEARNF